MLFGTYMGGFWIFKFLFFPLGLTVSFLLFLFVGLTLCVPFMGYRYARMYRDQVCGGSIGFLHAWLFTVFMYMFAALLTAVAHYIYFRFIDQGHIIDTCENLINTVSQGNVPGMEVYIATYREALEELRKITAIEWTMQMMSTNFFWCTLLALPTALFVRRQQ